ncbi:hypothetical protein ACIBSW_14100 [Actinoplanes sp. NPDC049668]|uniref:hypothetical protein n=1 Tax=unclassified Actinoplanes TaxID=2626549 RepID=UPI0033A57736
MSVLHQQRIRVSFNDFHGPQRPWQMSCPCCIHSHAFATWYEAIAWALTHLKLQHCRFCIDQQMPAGRDDLLGELFERCPACGPACENCHGVAVYPANYNTPTELVEDLATVRLTPVFCDGCHGVIAVIPLDPEVYA